MAKSKKKSFVKGKTQNAPANQRPGAVKNDQGQGQTNPTQTVPNTDASAGAE